MDQPHFQQTEVSFILNSSFQQFKVANINQSGDKPYHINAHYTKLAHFLKLQSFFLDSCTDSPGYNRADILCLHDVFSNARGYDIQHTMCARCICDGTYPH